jgi:hypothetical protein
MSIRLKLLLILLALGLTGVGIISYMGFQSGRASLINAVENQLTGLRRSKAQEIEAYFAFVRAHAITLSDDRMFVDAIRSFTTSFQKLDRPIDSIDRAALSRFYSSDFVPALSRLVTPRHAIEDYLPNKPQIPAKPSSPHRYALLRAMS